MEAGICGGRGGKAGPRGGGGGGERLMKGVWGKDRIEGRGEGTEGKFEVGYLYGVDRIHHLSDPSVSPGSFGFSLWVSCPGPCLGSRSAFCPVSYLGHSLPRFGKARQVNSAMTMITMMIMMMRRTETMMGLDAGKYRGRKFCWWVGRH